MEQELGWARQLGSREDIEFYTTTMRRLESDPVGFARQLLGELREQRMWEDAPATPAPTTPTPLVDPEPDLRSQDGKGAYSVDRLKEYVGAALQRQRAELLQELQPVMEYTTQARGRDQAQADQQRALSEIRSAMAELRQRPHYQQHEEAIKAEYQAIPNQLKARIGVPAALQLAYSNALEKVVIPGLSSRTTTTTVNDMQRAAVAGTTGAPTSGAPPTKPALKDGDVGGLAAHLRKLAATASQ